MATKIKQTIRIAPLVDMRALDSRKELKSKINNIDRSINNRITYILQTITNLFNVKFAYWFFPGAPEGEQGDPEANIDVQNTRVFIRKVGRGYLSKGTGYSSIAAILKDGTKWYLEGDDFDEYQFPTRWLLEPFEEELTQGKLKFEQIKQQELLIEKEKAQKDKKTVSAALKKIKNKLSKEEMSLLTTHLGKK